MIVMHLVVLVGVVVVCVVLRNVVYPGLAPTTQEHGPSVPNVRQGDQARAADDADDAPWMGQTGLGLEAERALAPYLRIEFGQLDEDTQSIKARDLRYVGLFALGGQSVYFWQVPSSDIDVFAYIEVSDRGALWYDWGDRVPPIIPASASTIPNA